MVQDWRRRPPWPWWCLWYKHSCIHIEVWWARANPSQTLYICVRYTLAENKRTTIEEEEEIRQQLSLRLIASDYRHLVERYEQMALELYRHIRFHNFLVASHSLANLSLGRWWRFLNTCWSCRIFFIFNPLFRLDWNLFERDDIARDRHAEHILQFLSYFLIWSVTTVARLLHHLLQYFFFSSPFFFFLERTCFLLSLRQGRSRSAWNIFHIMW